MDIQVQVSPKNGATFLPFTETLKDADIEEARLVYNDEGGPLFGPDGPDPADCNFEFNVVPGS